MRVALPVKWLLPDGAESNDTVAAKPCAHVGFLPSDSNRLDVAPHNVYAHIDTGCDYTIVDPSLLGTGSNPVAFKQAVTVAGESIVPIYRGAFVLTDGSALITLSTEYVALDLGNAPYKIMLGRHFLRYTQFRYDGRNPFNELVFTSDV